MAQTEQEKSAALFGKVIARAWRDPAFKAKLFSDLAGALKDAGVALPTGVKMTVVEDTSQHFHLVLPPKPTGVISDEALEMVAGGSCTAGDLCKYLCGGGSCQTGGPSLVGNTKMEPPDKSGQ